MSDSGREMLAALNQVRGLFEEMSRLLSTSDALMQESGWKPLKGSQVTAEMSWAIHLPRQWMPRYLCRFYESRLSPTYFHAFLSCSGYIMPANRIV